MNDRDKIVLLKIEKEAELLLKLADGHNLQSFLGDEVLMRAVCMTLINIGELVKLLTEDVKRQNQAISWRAVAGLRDVIAHGYYTLRMEDIWETATEEIPPFLIQVGEILNTEEKSHS